MGAKGTARMEVQMLADQWEPATQSFGTFTASAIRTRKDEYGSATTNFRLKSTFERDIRDARAVAIYYNGNKIIGGAYTFVDFVPAGGSTGVQIDAASAPSPPITKTAIYAAPSSLSTLTP